MAQTTMEGVDMNNGYEIKGCNECLQYIAYGTLPETRDLLSEIKQVWPGQDITIHVGSTEEYEFSHEPCQCCGSMLGGDRHQMFVTQGDVGMKMPKKK